MNIKKPSNKYNSTVKILQNERYKSLYIWHKNLFYHAIYIIKINTKYIILNFDLSQYLLKDCYLRRILAVELMIINLCKQI